MIKAFIMVAAVCSIALALGEEIPRLEATTDISEEAESFLEQGVGSTRGMLFWNISTSSTLPSKIGRDYGCHNLLDGLPETAWVEGEDSLGLGVTITISAPSFGDEEPYGSPESSPYELERLLFLNGYQASPKLWAANARVESLLLIYNERVMAYIVLQNTMEPQEVDLTGLIELVGWRVMPMDDGDELTFELLGAYPGEEYEDTALSEIALLGYVF
ncbi:hypothetical protein GF402_01430 [Candidatus Fermentibacteria bacterium]|nr:hypothetical protein [Candidatus Fermentibacteria bacterium]